MNDVLPPILVGPVLLALLPAMLPATVTARRLAWCAVLVAALTVGLALWSVIAASGASWPDGRPGAHPGLVGLWRNDRPAQTLVLLPPLCWLLVAVRALHPNELARSSGTRWRRWPIAAQLATACTMASCAADVLALLPVMLGLLLLLAGRLDGWNRVDRLPWLAAVPVMAIGVAILSAGIGAPARWDMLARASHGGRQQETGLVLLLAPVLLLAIAASIRPALADRTAPLRGLLSSLLLLAALALALRVRHAAPSGAVGPCMTLAGLGWIVLSLGLAPACRSLARRVSLAASVQAGVALAAIGSGGPGGIAAAVMLVGFLSLLLPLSLWFPLDTGSARLRSAAIVAMLGMPPFGPFTAGLVLLVHLWRIDPGLAVFLLLAACLSALSVLDAFGREPRPAPGFRVTPWVVCVSLVLLLVLWLGAAMPTGFSDWLLAMGGAGA